MEESQRTNNEPDKPRLSAKESSLHLVQIHNIRLYMANP